ncbi:hypothetical protein, partial [Pedobacter terrae]|uniref:hypothetical protein n=1 Tax=Pedobacter terrae TaxID=405671 RepID=UPI001ABF1DE2
MKNKIYFIWKFKKDAYLCNPNGNEGKTKNQNGGCRKDQQTGLKQTETCLRRTRLEQTEICRYIKTGREA